MESLATAAATAATVRAQRLANLRAYPKGVSGGSIKSRRYLEIRASIIASLDGEPSGIDVIAVDQIAQQLVRAERSKDHAESARCSRTAKQWLQGLQARHAKRAPDQRPLANYLDEASA
jgi:Fe-S cluster assembly ATPase SufC